MQVSSPQVCPSGLHCMGEDEVPVAYYAKSLQAAHRVVLVGTNAWFGIALYHLPPPCCYTRQPLRFLSPTAYAHDNQ